MGFFQVDRNKKTKKDNVFDSPRNLNKHADNMGKSEKLMNGIALWASYYRANPHKFIQEYIGVKLKLFQKFLIYMMNSSNYFMYIAARSQGEKLICPLK